LLHFSNYLKPIGQFVPYAVIGDPPGGVQTFKDMDLHNMVADIGIVNYYGGSWYSICSTDWGVQLESMANQMLVVHLMSWLRKRSNCRHNCC
jgi:hypothetical protein